jgi:hypothetical protein
VGFRDLPDGFAESTAENCRMQTTTIFLHQASDAEDSYALSLPGDAPGSWRAEKGFGSKFNQVWTLDLQTAEAPLVQAVDWDVVLARAIEAYSLNDPVITNYSWPLVARESRGTN